MKKWSLALVTLLLVVLFIKTPFANGSSVTSGDSSAGRVNSNLSSRPKYLLSPQFSSGTNYFVTADPSPAGTPLTETSATGITQSSGIVTLGLTNGFTAPVTLTCYVWIKDAVTPSNSYWCRNGAVAAAYAQAPDSNYTMVTFTAPPFTPFLIRSSAAITGNVYVDCIADGHNANRVTGY